MKPAIKAIITATLIFGLQYLSGCENHREAGDGSNVGGEIGEGNTDISINEHEDKTDTGVKEYFGGISTDRLLVTGITELCGDDSSDGGKVFPDCTYADALTGGYFKLFDKDYYLSIADSDGNTVLPYEYLKTLDIADGILPIYAEDGGWGYYSLAKNDFICDCMYSKAYTFSEGLGLLYDGEYYKFVNTEGDAVIDGLYEAMPFSDGYARVVNEDGMGYIDKSGKIVLYCDYEYFDDFSCGMARASDGEALGYIDKTGKMTLSIDCDRIYTFREDAACVVASDKAEYVDKDGNVIVSGYDAMPNGVRDEYFMFTCGIAPVMKSGKYGFVNKQGQEVIPCEYDRVYIPSEGTVMVEKDGKFGYRSVDGKVICECIYDNAGSFHSGTALVWKDDMCGYINTSGDVIYDICLSYATDFSGDAAFVYIPNGSEASADADSADNADDTDNVNNTDSADDTLGRWAVLKISGYSEREPFVASQS